FRSRTNTTVNTRNVTIKNPDSTVPQLFQQYSKGLECTHDGKYKYRDHGKRRRQERRPIRSWVDNASSHNGSVEYDKQTKKGLIFFAFVVTHV
ncbi:hypothetical protein PHMEG_00030899, partial [Phytophthora megakarya]